jgi:two-component system chemotaxis sensor kinase CheA
VEGGDAKAPHRLRPSLLRVDAHKFEQIRDGIEELELYSMRALEACSEDDVELQADVKRLVELSRFIGRNMQQIYLVPIRQEMNRLKKFAEDLAGKTNKHLEFLIRHDNFEIDTRYLDVLSEVLVHLVRNAVDHGIEYKGERELLQKVKTGLVQITAMKTERGLLFQVLDDGKGMDRGEILEHARRTGIADADSEGLSIFDIITNPGFTTKSEATVSSGRGYGLDLVVQRLRSIPDAIFRMTTVPGKGTVFTILVPSGYTNIPVLVTGSRDLQVAVPHECIQQSEDVDRAQYSNDKNSGLLYRDKPVYTVRGRVTKSGKIPPEKKALFIRCRGVSAYLLVDEVLFEKEIVESQIDWKDHPEPHLYRIRAGTTRADFLYLDPEIFLSRAP